MISTRERNGNKEIVKKTLNWTQPAKRRRGRPTTNWVIHVGTTNGDWNHHTVQINNLYEDNVRK